MFDLSTYKVKSATPSNTISVHITYDPFGWSHFVLDTEIYVLSVNSDWGTWSYRWGGAGFRDGATFEEEIIRFGEGDSFYLANKLVGGSSTEFSSSGTVKALLERLLHLRRNNSIDAETAGRLHRDISEAHWDSHDDFYYSDLASDLQERGFSFIPDYTREENTTGFDALTQLLIPSLLTFLKEKNQ